MKMGLYSLIMIIMSLNILFLKSNCSMVKNLKLNDENISENKKNMSVSELKNIKEDNTNSYIKSNDKVVKDEFNNEKKENNENTVSTRNITIGPIKDTDNSMNTKNENELENDKKDLIKDKKLRKPSNVSDVKIDINGGMKMSYKTKEII